MPAAPAGGEVREQSVECRSTVYPSCSTDLFTGFLQTALLEIELDEQGVEGFEIVGIDFEYLVFEYESGDATQIPRKARSLFADRDQLLAKTLVVRVVTEEAHRSVRRPAPGYETQKQEDLRDLFRSSLRAAIDDMMRYEFESHKSSCQS
jgi:hypothetical protein